MGRIRKAEKSVKSIYVRVNSGCPKLVPLIDVNDNDHVIAISDYFKVRYEDMYWLISCLNIIYVVVFNLAWKPISFFQQQYSYHVRRRNVIFCRRLFINCKFPFYGSCYVFICKLMKG
jgi:hypothetical protein